MNTINKRIFDIVFSLPETAVLLPVFAVIIIAIKISSKGLGLQLLQKGLAGCAKRGIDKVKVLVGVDNKPANELYQKCGFELVAQIENHGILSNVYVVDTAKKYTK
jgi:L-amino acid N-acyltransferase YncA